MKSKKQIIKGISKENGWKKMHVTRVINNSDKDNMKKKQSPRDKQKKSKSQKKNETLVLLESNLNSIEQTKDLEGD